LSSDSCPSSTYQPIKSLRAFQRVSLDPGQSKTVTLEIPVKQLAYYDARIHDFRVEPGVFDMLVGSSSEDIRLRGETSVTTAASTPRPQVKN
jgi:beta-glucosidase